MSLKGITVAAEARILQGRVRSKMSHCLGDLGDASYTCTVRVGDNIAGYDIVAKMKSGGMAALYLGRRSRSGGFEKHVAIKVVHEHLSENEDFTVMFLDEARISASIEHPNVVHVHDLGTTDSGRDFLVMEYVPGVALSQVMRAFRQQQRRPTPAIATWIAMQVAAGLHAAHELTTEDGKLLGVVHRDVSPKNVLIAYKGYVKLIDFGIAKAADRIHHTQGALIKGTFRYMSPEQAHGTPLDRRTDIYALGIMLWELLTQQKLFDAPNDILLLDLVRNPKIPPPSSLAPDVSPALDAIVMKALALDPNDRPATTAAFRAELAAAVPEALGVTQGEVAELIGLAMENHVPGPEDPSVRSAMGAPRQPKPGSAERLTRDLGPALTSSGSAALNLIPSLVTPTPLAVSGVRTANVTATPLMAASVLPTQTGPSRTMVVGVALVFAALCGVGGAMLATRGDMQAVPLAPMQQVSPPTTQVAEPVVVEPTPAEIETRLREEAAAAEARLEAERAALAEEAEQEAEEEAARVREEELAARRERIRQRNMRAASMMSSSMMGPLIVDDF
ncbi:MAG: serine/threonine protein kinase [Polyangiales bacterium]|jgi:serine/threonine protein kinase